MSCPLLDELRHAEKFPTAPGIALRIVELNEKEQIDIDELAALLRQDPALVASILRTANSSLYGIPRRIADIEQAILILGLRSVNMMALSFSILSTSSGEGCPAFDYRRYWTAAAATAITAQGLARRAAPAAKWRDCSANTD